MKKISTTIEDNEAPKLKLFEWGMGTSTAGILRSALRYAFAHPEDFAKWCRPQEVATYVVGLTQYDAEQGCRIRGLDPLDVTIITSSLDAQGLRIFPHDELIYFKPRLREGLPMSAFDYAAWSRMVDAVMVAEMRGGRK